MDSESWRSPRRPISSIKVCIDMILYVDVFSDSLHFTDQVLITREVKWLTKIDSHHQECYIMDLYKVPNFGQRPSNSVVKLSLKRSGDQNDQDSGHQSKWA